MLRVALPVRTVKEAGPCREIFLDMFSASIETIGRNFSLGGFEEFTQSKRGNFAQNKRGNVLEFAHNLVLISRVTPFALGKLFDASDAGIEDVTFFMGNNRIYKSRGSKSVGRKLFTF